MPVQCNFIVIQGDENKVLGDRGDAKWEKTFNTAGRRSGGEAILMLMVKGLTATRDALVKINNVRVGQIFHCIYENRDYWFTQIIDIGPDILKDGDNQLQIVAASLPHPKPGELYDDFYIRDVICFFHQSG